MQDKIPVAVFPSLADTDPLADDLILADLASPAEWQTVDNKADAWLYSPALYPPGTSRAKGDPGPSHLTALVLDFDDGTKPADALAAWDGLECFLHSTFSHTDAHPKFRLVIPLQDPVPAHEWPAFWDAARQITPQIDPQCKDPTRIYYLPVVRRGQRPLALRQDGLRLQFADLMGREPSPAPSRQPAPAQPRPAPGQVVPLFDRKQVRVVREEMSYDDLRAACDFADHAYLYPEKLDEPSWRAQLSLAIRCHGGDTLAHELSAGHPDYDPDKTQAKIDALRQVGPFTRRAIMDTTAAEGLCESCPLADACERSGPLNAAKAQAATPPGAAQALEAEAEALIQARLRRDHAADPKTRAAAVREVTERSAKVKALKGEVEKAQRAALRAEAHIAAQPEQADAGVWSSLDIKQNGAPVLSEMNMLRIFTGDPHYKGLRWNELASTVEGEGLDVAMLGDPGTGARILADLVDRYNLTSATFKGFVAPLVAAARRNSYHPVADWLQALPAWDGVDRVPLLCAALGADPTPLHAAYVFKTLIGAVARIADPGCQLDTMLVLQGDQGVRKSTGLRALFEGPVLQGWFSSTQLDLQQKDARLAIHRVWVTEFAELASMSKKDDQTIKAFLTEQSDLFRAPYGAAVVDHPRRCAFVGTTNEEHFLRDPTGARRFWVLPVDRVDVAGILALRDAVFAQALHAYHDGAQWWLEDDLAAEQRRVNAMRWQAPDPIYEALYPWWDALDGKDGVPLKGAAMQAGIVGGALTPAIAKQVASVLKRLGMIRKHTNKGNLWFKA